MKYTLNEYLPYADDMCTRIIVFPNSDIGAKLVAEYSSRDIAIVPMRKLFSAAINKIPSPQEAITAIKNYTQGRSELVLFVGIDSYLELLTNRDKSDFLIGLCNLLDSQNYNIHFLMSYKSTVSEYVKNPKYEGAMYLITINGDIEESSIEIVECPAMWCNNLPFAKVLGGVWEALGDYIPSGKHLCWISDEYLPSANYGNVNIIKCSLEALQTLYQVEVNISNQQADTLLRKCNEMRLSPMEVITERFGGEQYISCEKAPAKLFELKDDELWDLFVWLLKTKIKEDTYLSKVLKYDLTAENFLEYYIVVAAKDLLNTVNAKKFAEERASVLTRMTAVEPLIARFVAETEGNDASVIFMNCGTSAELSGLIRRAAKYDLRYRLPEKFDFSAPIINCYTAPDFDYSDRKLTAYFTKLRYNRIKNTIDEDFVSEAHRSRVPHGIEKRDAVLPKYDDGKTALLIVDGLGAEYFPLLINLSRQNNLSIQEKRIVEVNLPTSTDFNHIKWSTGNELQQVKRVDEISHAGYAKHEKCSYEDNLTELFLLFQKTILTRVVSGLKDFDRVIVTADHGSSYLAVTAHQNKLTNTLSWDDPQDWRYTSLPNAKECSDDYEIVYLPSDGRTYYVVRGYNRLPKQGGKLYGLHGGATLEERLVPFVVFTRHTNEEIVIETPIVQIEENDDFDIL